MKRNKKRGLPRQQSEESKEGKEPENLSKKRAIQQKISLRDIIKDDDLPQISNLSIGDIKGFKLEKMAFNAEKEPGMKYGTAQYTSLADWKKKTGQSMVRIYSWNVNGFNAVAQKNSLQEFLKDADPDILCLNETKMAPEKLVKTALWQEVPSTYEQHWNCSKEKAGYSGVAVFTKIAPIDVQQDIKISKHDQEGRVITMEFEEFILISCYTVNAGEGLKRVNYRVDEWDVDFFKFVKKLEEKKKPVVLSGDLNCAHGEIDVYDPKGKDKVPGFSPQERKSFGDFLESHDFIDTFRNLYPTKQQFTFWSQRAKMRPSNRGWRLDYFLIGRQFLGHVKDSLIHNQYMGSDHCPIELKFELESGSKADKNIDTMKNLQDKKKYLKQSEESQSKTDTQPDIKQQNQGGSQKDVDNIEHFAACVLNPEGASGVSGHVLITQQTGFGKTKISGKITGLKPGSYGLRIHEFGNLSEGVSSTGAVFNPPGASQGSSESEARAVGDLGTITAGDDGIAVFEMEDHLVKLSGTMSVIGRSLVIHSYGHEHGQGGFISNGARLACGVIGASGPF